MNLGVEDYLQQIDVSFKDKGQNDIYMIYVLVFGVLFAFSYLLFWESAEEEYNVNYAKVVKVKADIATDLTYLQRNPPRTITLLDRDIKQLGVQFKNEQENNRYIKEKIEKISSLIYDEVTWGEYLHSISKNAKKYNIKIMHFNNQYAKTDEGFGHILDISLQAIGSYKNTLSFINSLEQSELVIDLHDLTIEAKKKLHSDLNISVWGITYQ